MLQKSVFFSSTTGYEGSSGPQKKLREENQKEGCRNEIVDTKA
jgi:hypothetical protein